MVKILLNPCGKLGIVTYHYALQPTFTTKHSINNDPIVAFLFGGFTHLSVFNDLILCPYIVPRHFNPAYRSPPLRLDHKATKHSSHIR
jgi:hypothetical protein